MLRLQQCCDYNSAETATVLRLQQCCDCNSAATVTVVTVTVTVVTATVTVVTATFVKSGLKHEKELKIVMFN